MRKKKRAREVETITEPLKHFFRWKENVKMCLFSQRRGDFCETFRSVDPVVLPMRR